MSPKKKFKPSYLWSYFSVSNSEKKVALCDLCGQLLKFRTTISNLKKHLEKRHPVVKIPPKKIKTEDCFNLLADSSSSSVACVSSEFQVEQTSKSHTGQYESNLEQESTLPEKENPNAFLPHQNLNIASSKKISEFRKKKIDKLLLQLFIHDYYPFSIVEDEGFVNFVNGLNHLYKLPCRKTIKNCMIPESYEKCLKAVCGELMSVNSVCLSTDTWTSVNVESYLAVTAHYITEGFKLRSILLDCLLIPESHTSANLAELISCITEKFHLTDKVLLIVSDNASIINSDVTKELKKDHIGCFAHTLNLILKDVLKIPKELIDKIKSIISYFKRNSSDLETFKCVQKTTLDLEPKQLILEDSTRWNTTFYMIQRFFELQEAVKTTIALINEDLPILTEDEWTACKELCIVLEPFEDVIKNISGECYLTGSLIIPLTNGLRSLCERMQNEEFGSIAKFVIDELLKGINQRLTKIEENESLALATFLDPRFKLVPFSNEFTTRSVKEHCTRLIAEILAQHSEKVDASADTTDNCNQDVTSSKSSVGHTIKYSVWETLDNKIALKNSSGAKMSAALIEVDKYIEDTFLDRKEDPLLWWQNNQYNYPLMARLVKSKFNVVGTSVPCESLFSEAGILITERRSRFKEKDIEKLLFLNVNSFLLD